MNLFDPSFRRLPISSWLPWAIGSAAFLVLLIISLALPVSAVLRWASLGCLAVLLALGAYFARARIVRLLRAQAGLQNQLAQMEASLSTARRDIAAVLRFNQAISAADEENEILKQLLHLSVEVVEGLGASFVPLDEHEQPLAALSHGELPPQVLSAWIEYLASPAIRQRCGACQNHAARMTDCPLLQSFLPDLTPSNLAGVPESALSYPQSGAGAVPGVYCLPLHWSGREYGVLNLILPAGKDVGTERQSLLDAIMKETALALENARLKRREMATFRQLQAVRHHTDLKGLLSPHLEALRAALEADFVFLSGHNPLYNQPVEALAVGDLPAGCQPFLDRVAQSVLTIRAPRLLGEGAADNASPQAIVSLAAFPLLLEENQVLGVVLAGNTHPVVFSQPYLERFQAQVSGVARLLRDAERMAELEYNTLIAERARLAREIHDGLAQTLGFLKLQAAQLRDQLRQGELEHLQDSLQAMYAVLTEAYQDARQAIDGLRLFPSGEGLVSWLEQASAEFQETSGVHVHPLDLHGTAALAPEVQAQLIRIVQEALSNIRKHAQASQVWISARSSGEDLIVEVRDDGRGFSPEDVPGASRYGLRGMRERAELIGADFQIISCNQGGTTVRVQLPILLAERTV